MYSLEIYIHTIITKFLAKNQDDVTIINYYIIILNKIKS